MSDEVTYRVPDIHCDHCKAAITDRVSKVPGVTAVAVDIEAATVAVTGDPLPDAEVRLAIEDAGYALAE